MPSQTRTATLVVPAAAVLAACAGPAGHQSASIGATSVRTVATQPLPALDGSRLVTTLVEVRYPPGGSSTAHQHPCAVVGQLRSQVAGQAEAVYPAGASFYEPPNSVHTISANASTTAPVRFLAWFTCDRDTPLSTPVGAAVISSGRAR
jgi:quercetin dioxygenase-like cupin family protein